MMLLITILTLDVVRSPEQTVLPGSGLIAHVEGKVYLNEQSVEPTSTPIYILNPNSVVRTEAGDSAETLLCATAVDQMHQGPRTNYDRELFAQGVGNTLCGLLGSIPMTGVIVRSSANIEAGGRTRGSAIFHGIWLLCAVSLLPWLLSRIPTTSLAALLVFTGFKLVSPKAIRLLRQYGKSEVAIYAATVIAIVTTDLLKGVLFGLVLSLGKLVYTFSHLDVKLIRNLPKEGQMTMELRGAATFVRLPKLAAAFESVPGSMHLHIVLDKLDYIDHACIDLLSNWEKQHEAGGGQIIKEWTNDQNQDNSCTDRFLCPR